MPKLAYRFLPCDDDGQPRENTAYTTIPDAEEELGVGSVLTAEIFGYHEWEVIEVREDPGSLISATEADGTPLAIGGTLVCRGVRRHS